MNKFDASKLQTRLNHTPEGWLVQIYGRDRRLLCVLEASHAWTFLVGCGFGLVLAVGWFNLAQASSSAPYVPATTSPEMWVD